MKKVSVRILAVLAAFVLLFAAVPMVAAEDTPLTLVLDTPQTVEVGKKVTVLFTYTASEAGTYIFRSQAPKGIDPVGQLLGENGEVLASNDDSEGSMNFRLDVELAAGESCTFLVKSNHTIPKSFPVTLFKSSVPTKVEMFGGADAVTLSLLEKRNAKTVVYPENVTAQTITYTSANRAVVTVNAEGELTATGVGTTTVTVTVDGTLTDRVTVHVPEPLVWGTAIQKDIILTAEPSVRTYRFTVEQDGLYEIFSEGPHDPGLEVYEQTATGRRYLAKADDENGFNFALTRAFEAGKTYYLLLSAYAVEGALTYPVTVRAAAEDTTPETGVDFVADRITVSVGDLFLPDYRLAPNETVESLTAADASIVSGSTGDVVTALKVGKTTLTIQTVSGAADTIEVEVVAPPALVLGQKTTMAINEIRTRHYAIRPEETGTYVLRSFGTGAADPQVVLYDDKWNVLAEQDDGGSGWNFLLESTLTAGKTYYVGVTNYEPAPFDVLFAKRAPATGVSLTLLGEDYLKNEDGTYTVFVNTTALAQVAFMEIGAIEETYSLATGDTAIAAMKRDTIRFLAPGETTVTVTTANGLTDTIRVVVMNRVAGDITLDGKVTREDLAFIKDYLQDPDVLGDLWYLGDYNQDGEVNAADVEAMEVALPKVPATAVSLGLPAKDYVKFTNGVYTVFSDTAALAQVIFGTDKNAVEEAYTFSVEKETVARVERDTISFLAPGETTVTVTTANGLTATITVVVVNYVRGDVTLDGALTEEDLAVLQAYLQDPAVLGDLWYLADYTQDGAVTAADVQAMEAILYGLLADVDGDGEVTSTDARMTLQYAAGKLTASNVNIVLAEVDGDGEITSTDARLILQRAVGKISAFPVE